MKVNKNDPTYPVNTPIEFFGTAGGAYVSKQGIPLRLKIAAKLLAAYCTTGIDDLDYIDRTFCKKALDLADHLIKEHNESC